MDREQMAKLLNVAYLTGAHRSCGGKRKYHIENDAIGAIKRQNKHIKKEFQQYPCPFCLSWHIGRLMKPDELSSYSQKLSDHEIDELIRCFE